MKITHLVEFKVFKVVPMSIKIYISLNFLATTYFSSNMVIYIKMPNSVEVDTLSNDFHNICKMESIIGAIGHSHIQIQEPIINAENFLTPNGYFMFQIQGNFIFIFFKQIIHYWKITKFYQLMCFASNGRIFFCGELLLAILLALYHYKLWSFYWLISASIFLTLYLIFIATILQSLWNKCFLGDLFLVYLSILLIDL